MSEFIGFNGKASADHGGPAEHGGLYDKGDKIIAVVEGTVKGFDDRQTEKGGDSLKLVARVGEVMLLTGEEFGDFRQRLAKQRSERENPGQTSLDDDAAPTPDAA